MNQYLEEAFVTAAKLKKKYSDAEQKISELLIAVLVNTRSGKDTRVRFVAIKKEVEELLALLRKDAISWCHVDLASVFVRGVMQCDLDTVGNVNDNDLADEYEETVGIIVQEAEDRFESVNETIFRNVSDILAAITLTILSARLVKPVIGGQVVSPPMQNVRLDNLQKDLMERGITGFVDRTGAQWKVQTYIETVLDNNIIQAYRRGYVMRMTENGFDLVDVVGGINENSCDDCIDIVMNHPVLSITGATPGYMTVAEAEEQGLGHINCVHYYEYHQEQNTANPNAG